MRIRLGWRRPLLFIVVLLVIISVVVYLWDFHFGINSQLLSSIFAGLVAVILTIFGIDRLLAYRENARWRQAKSSALMEIDTCLNGMLTNVRGLAKIGWDTVVGSSTKGISWDEWADEWAKDVSEIITEYFERRSDPLAKEIADRVRERDQESWDYFFSGIQSCIQELDRIVAMFPSIISQPELVERIISVRRAARVLFYIRTAFFDRLGIPLDMQPMPKNGDRKRSSDLVHDFALKTLDEFIVSIVQAKKVVSVLLYESA